MQEFRLKPVGMTILLYVLAQCLLSTCLLSVEGNEDGIVYRQLGDFQLKGICRIMGMNGC